MDEEGPDRGEHQGRHAGQEQRRPRDDRDVTVGVSALRPRNVRKEVGRDRVGQVCGHLRERHGHAVEAQRRRRVGRKCRDEEDVGSTAEERGQASRIEREAVAQELAIGDRARRRRSGDGPARASPQPDHPQGRACRIHGECAREAKVEHPDEHHDQDRVRDRLRQHHDPEPPHRPQGDHDARRERAEEEDGEHAQGRDHERGVHVVEEHLLQDRPERDDDQDGACREDSGQDERLPHHSGGSAPRGVEREGGGQA